MSAAGSDRRHNLIFRKVLNKLRITGYTYLINNIFLVSLNLSACNL
jgi:hypothetical protein